MELPSTGRHALAAGVLGAMVLGATVLALQLALLVGAWSQGMGGRAAVGYALGAVLVVALGYRRPAAGFALAVGLVAAGAMVYLVLLWAAYQAGRRAVSRAGTGVVVTAALAGLAVQVAACPRPRALPQVLAAYLVFVALPALAGRYVAQHRRLLAALTRHNAQLRRERDLIAERERLRERLRIARDMHDSLGRRLGLICIQAAALEVAAPPGERDEAVRHLADTAREAAAELAAVVGALRAAPPTGPDHPPTPSPAAVRQPGATDAVAGLPVGATDAVAGSVAGAVDAVVAQFRSAGVPVGVRRRGEPGTLDAAAGEAAYRVVEEGLTNAARHAPGRPVAVELVWEPDALLLSVVNALVPGGTAAYGGGYGLTGLDERVRQAGGLLDHRAEGGTFRLSAMLPVRVAEARRRHPSGTTLVALAMATLVFVVLPASMLLGVG